MTIANLTGHQSPPLPRRSRDLHLDLLRQHAAQLNDLIHRLEEEVIVETLPPLERRPEWRNHQALARQTTHTPPPPNEFKAGTWGTGRRNKHNIRDILSTKGKYMLSTWKGGTPEQISTRREKEMKNVHKGDILHMVSCDHKIHYRGVVRSEFRGMSRTELFTEYQDLTLAAWGEAGPDEHDNHFKICDVEWSKMPLTDEMNTYLSKLTKNGGGCTKQCGTLIPLA